MIEAIAPLDRLPVYVREGSIVPLGPDEEWSAEKAADPIELRIYRGADGKFTLYETTQAVMNYRDVMAAMLGVPPENVQVITRFLGFPFQPVALSCHG